MIASVVVTTYNRAQMLSECLDSCAQQTMKDCEFLVVDDGSTDSTESVVDKYATADKRVTYLKKEHSGQSATINHGMRACQGDVVCWLCDDDLFFDHTSLDKRVNELNALEKYGIEVLFTSCEEIWQDGRSRDVYRARNVFADEILNGDGGIYLPSAIWKRKIHDRIGYFPEVGNYPDWGWKFKLVMSCSWAICPGLVTAKYRRWHGQQGPEIDRLGTRGKESVAQLEWIWKEYAAMFSKYDEQGRWKS